MKTILLLSACVSLFASLDDFLLAQGYQLTPSGTVEIEGYITPKQKALFIDELSRLNIQTIAEVGFNAGHTSEIFLEYVPLSQVVSFDINSHYYTNAGVAYLKMEFQDRFEFIEGDSRITIPTYFQTHPDTRFDLIYVDGCHLFEFCLDDILHFKNLAHEKTVLWIDDANFEGVQKAIEFAEKLKIIKVIESHTARDAFGLRAWVEARYLL